MGLGKAEGIVIGRRPLGESDRLVTFYTRQLGKVRGVARAARRPRSRFGSALELFTVGELVFFDTGRSDLLRIDHFDVVRAFRGLREDLERLGHASWMVECVARLTADHDPHPALYRLLRRGLTAAEGPGPASTAAICFGVRCVDLLGHRPRLDRCIGCGRRYPFGPAALDVSAGGLVCRDCEPEAAGAMKMSAPAVAAWTRLGALSWEEALTLRLDRLELELSALVDGYVSRLIGQPTRTPRFLRELRRLSRPSEARRWGSGP
jgi:DNA repair protein RecO (recombination protein O)